ncbi:MAG TPA: hypothetical protein DHV36_16830 [Desulfobacteraceae bacterium]|nr:hypothetical protein [Desulfobacteraceae bacterium]|tara:strand:+ start:952 stop:1854 length:903 start_codon:yes stop_codon:yes gene_type:complete
MTGIQKKDLTIRPTQHGYLFLGILVAMLLGSINYNNNAGFILVFLLGGMAVISLFHSFKNLTGLVFIPHPVHPVFKGESIIFPVEIKGNQGQAQSLFLSIKNADPVHFSLSGSNARTADLKLPASRRGVIHIKNILLTSVYPFGLFRLKAVIPFSAEGIVYPAPEPGTFPLGFAGEDDDGEETSRHMGPDDFQGLKPYIPGNPIGHIAWKTLSRGQGLFVKDFTADAGRDILIDINLMGQGDIETKLSMICHKLLSSETLGVQYGLRLGSSFSTLPAGGKPHLHRCLEALALYNPPGDDT